MKIVGGSVSLWQTNGNYLVVSCGPGVVPNSKGLQPHKSAMEEAFFQFSAALPSFLI